MKKKISLSSSSLSYSIFVQSIREFCECRCYSFLYCILPLYTFGLRGGVSILFIFALAFPDDTAINIKRCGNEHQAVEGYFCWKSWTSLVLALGKLQRKYAQNPLLGAVDFTYKCHHFSLVGVTGSQQSSGCLMRSGTCADLIGEVTGKKRWLQSIDSPVPPPAGIRCHQNKHLAWNVSV